MSQRNQLFSRVLTQLDQTRTGLSFYSLRKQRLQIESRRSLKPLSINISRSDQLLSRAKIMVTQRESESVSKTIGALEKVSKHLCRKRRVVKVRQAANSSCHQILLLKASFQLGPARFRSWQVQYFSRCFLEVYSEGFSLTRVQNETAQKILMFAGLTSARKAAGIMANMFDLQTNCWSSVETHGDVPDNRFGHSAHFAHGKVWVLGGVTISSVGRLHKYCSQLLCLNLETWDWQRVPFTQVKLDSKFSEEGSKNQFQSSGRAYHASGCVSNGLFVYGGAIDKHTLCNTVFRLGFNGTVFIYHTEDQYSGIYHHKIWVFSPTDKSVKLLPYQLKARKQFILSFFGKSETGCAIAGVRQLDFQHCKNGSYEWKPLEARGLQPSPRFKFSLERLRKTFTLVLAGGANQKGEVFDDLYLFNVANCSWQLVLTDRGGVGIFNHQSASCDEGIIIFGGMNDRNQINSKMYKLMKC